MVVSQYQWIVSITEFDPRNLNYIEQQFAAHGITVDLSLSGRMSKATAQTLFPLFVTDDGRQILKAVFQNFICYSCPHEMLGSESGHALTAEDVDLDIAAIQEHLKRKAPGHSAALVVADQWGNVASVLHTINSEKWGSGVFAQGIALNNAACSQQNIVASVPAGHRLPDATEPLIVLQVFPSGSRKLICLSTGISCMLSLIAQNGQPIVAGSVIGTSLRATSLLDTMQMLQPNEPDPKSVNDAPDFFLPAFPMPSQCTHVGQLGCSFPINTTVAEGFFSEFVLSEVEHLQVGVNRVPASAAPAYNGYWVGLRIIPSSLPAVSPLQDAANSRVSSLYQASAPFTLNSWAEGL